MSPFAIKGAPICFRKWVHVFTGTDSFVSEMGLFAFRGGPVCFYCQGVGTPPTCFRNTSGLPIAIAICHRPTTTATLLRICKGLDQDCLASTCSGTRLEAVRVGGHLEAKGGCGRYSSSLQQVYNNYTTTVQQLYNNLYNNYTTIHIL